jgi:hypothetical protein
MSMRINKKIKIFNETLTHSIENKKIIEKEIPSCFTYVTLFGINNLDTIPCFCLEKKI